MLDPIGDRIAVTRARRAHSADYRAAKEAVAPYEAIARLLIAYRVRHGLTQKDLAERIGTTGTAISRLEAGQYPPRLETLRRIAEATGERLLIGFAGPAARRSSRGAVNEPTVQHETVVV